MLCPYMTQWTPFEGMRLDPGIRSTWRPEASRRNGGAPGRGVTAAGNHVVHYAFIGSTEYVSVFGAQATLGFLSGSEMW